MLVHGIRGSQVQDTQQPMSSADLDVYGVDWEGLQEDRLLDSQERNNSADEGQSTWSGNSGPPDLNQLSEVTVDAPIGPLSGNEISHLDRLVVEEFGLDLGFRLSDRIAVDLWTYALLFARQLHDGF